jgi:hypothetical protein
MSDRTFVGLHIPKCAGTSFMEMAMSALPHHHMVQTTALIRNRDEGRPQFFETASFKTLKLIWGHAVHEEMLYLVDHPFLFTGLREPAERIASHARFDIYLARTQGRAPLDVEKWLSLQQDPICRYIIERFPRLSGDASMSLFERAKSALSAFHFVYFTNNFEKSSSAIMQAMGYMAESKKENVATVDVPIEVNRDYIRHDLALYEWAVDRFGDMDLDLDAEAPAPFQKFMLEPSQEHVLEEFIFRQQALEYDFWNIIDQVAKEKLDAASRALAEARYYMTFARYY